MDCRPEAQRAACVPGTGIGWPCRSAIRRLETQTTCWGDAAYRKAIVGKMQEAITRGALLCRQLLDAARPRPKSIDGFVTGSRLAAIAGTLDRALRPDITVRTEIAPDLWAFNADPEELYFALLNLCRNSADAMPDGGAITVAVRNVEPSAGAARGWFCRKLFGCGPMVPASQVLRGGKFYCSLSNYVKSLELV